MSILTSLDNPRVKLVLRLRQRRYRRRSGLFVAEGIREVQRALEAGLKLREAFVCPEMIQGKEDDIRTRLTEATLSGARQLDLSRQLLNKITYRERPEGLLAIFEQPPRRLEDLELQEHALLLVAVGTTKPGNLGAMARVAAATGTDAILAADSIVDPFNPNAIRSSTGAVFTLPVISASTEAIQQFLLERRIGMVATSPHAEHRYTEVDLAQSVALVIGAEDIGLDNRWLASSKACVRIPMLPGLVDSLNAATAAAVLLYESRRQRRFDQTDRP